jgi:hypothetical protein
MENNEINKKVEDARNEAVDGTMLSLMEHLMRDAHMSQLGEEFPEMEDDDPVWTTESLDGIVRRWNLPKQIIPVDSSIRRDRNTRKVKAVSEAMSDEDSMYICRGILAKTSVKTIQSLVRTEDFNSLKAHYFAQKLYLQDPEEILSKTNIRKRWGDEGSQEKEIMFWRWQEGLAFLDYRERVEYLMNKYLLVKGNSIVEEMKEYANVKTMADALSDEQTSIIASGQFPMIKRIMSRLNIEDNLMSTYHLSLLDEGEKRET